MTADPRLAPSSDAVPAGEVDRTQVEAPPRSPLDDQRRGVGDHDGPPGLHHGRPGGQLVAAELIERAPRGTVDVRPAAGAGERALADRGSEHLVGPPPCHEHAAKVDGGTQEPVTVIGHGTSVGRGAGASQVRPGDRGTIRTED